MTVEEEEDQGYIVKTKSNIQLNTLIYKYTEFVFFLRDKVFDENDSIMYLISSQISDLTYAITGKKNNKKGRNFIL